jgi:hypothetical protein
MTPLSATLTQDRHGQPLVVLDGGPFNGLEIAPAALRELAGHLDALARLAVSRPTGGKRHRPLVVTVGYAQAAQATTQQQG